MIRAATPSAPLRTAVLVSGEGSNLQALIDAYAAAESAVRLVGVASTRAGVRALERAGRATIPTAVLARGDDPGARDTRLAAWLEGCGAELVVCAGWLGLLGAEVYERFVCVNVHPALTPAFPGTQAAVDAIAYGVRVTGVTVFLVDGGTDSGPVLLQEAVRVDYDDTSESLLERLHPVEHRLVVEAVGLLAADRVRLEGRRVRIEAVEEE